MIKIRRKVILGESSLKEILAERFDLKNDKDLSLRISQFPGERNESPYTEITIEGVEK